jgi:hypothetical protein
MQAVSKKSVVDSKRAFAQMNSRICKSTSELENTFQEMAALIPDMIDEELRDVMTEIYLRLIGWGTPPTPIKSGRARTGWHLDIQPSDWCPPDMKDSPKSAAEIMDAARHVIEKLPKSQVYYLYNNVPYILRLERGWSEQAPQGFIAIALKSTADALQRRVQEFKK